MNKKSTTIWLKILIYIFIVSIFIQLIPARSVSANTPEQDLVRRKLWMLSGCLDNTVIHTNRDYNTLEDLLGEVPLKGGKWADEEGLVAGFDIDSRNGVITCRSAFTMGICTFTRGAKCDEDDVLNYIMQKVTGGKNIENNEGKKIEPNKEVWDRNLENFRQQVLDAMKRNGGDPSRAVRAERLRPIIDVCYTFSEKPTGTLGKDDFKVSGLGYFYLKDDKDIKAFVEKYANDGKIGDIDIKSVGGSFYPLGNDLAGVPTKSDAGLVDCKLVNASKTPSLAWIYDGLKVANGKLVDENGNQIAAPAPSGSEDSNKPNCEDEGGAWGWFLCGVFRLLDAALNRVDSITAKLLNTSADKYQDGGSYEPAQKSWLVFRNVAFVGIVIAMLVMIISTAMSLDFVSAYTVKTVLPKLVISVILIAVSFEICMFLINFFDMLGKGVMGILTQPFGGRTIDSMSQIIGPGFDSFLTGIAAGVGLLILGFSFGVWRC